MLITDNMSDLSNIPYQLIISFIIGYIGYWVAYQGYEINDNIKNYKILIFALPSLVISYIVKLQKIETLGIMIFLFVLLLIVTVFLAILWRKWGIDLIDFVLFKCKISNSNGYDRVTQDIGREMERGLKAGKLIVYLNNGVYFESLLSRHENKPIGMFKIDIDGNILMYVDKINGEEEKKIDSTEITITYIPKESISCFDLVNSKN